MSETKFLSDNIPPQNISNTKFIFKNKDNKREYKASIDLLIQHLTNRVLLPFLTEQIGQIEIDINNQHNGVKTYQDIYLKYILCDGTRNVYNVADYPLLAGKIPIENGGFLIIPNALDRTIRQILSAETVGMTQEDDVKNHSHSMNHDHDMSHQHMYRLHYGSAGYFSSGQNTNGLGNKGSLFGGRDRTGGSSTANTGATGSTTRMKNLGVNMYLVAGINANIQNPRLRVKKW
ncbi:MAG: hypothetical protein LBQ34_02945 [Alphaproteobacteria bacterium]|jgi:hypothetical protein|nr:hypothetical protein [Alphaproteobacteria bacterium]